MAENVPQDPQDEIAREAQVRAAKAAQFRWVANAVQKASQKAGLSLLEATAVLLSIAGQQAALCNVPASEMASNIIAAWEHKRAQMADDQNRVKVPQPVIVGPDGEVPA